MKISMLELMGGDQVALAGSENGKQAVAKLITLVSRAEVPEPLFLDFKGIYSATGSFLREVVLGFRNYSQTLNINLFPVVANADEKVLEDLQLMLERAKDIALVCTLSNKDKPVKVWVVGEFDETQRETLEAVTKKGEADAVQLATEEGKTEGRKEVQATKWNNRLSSLASRGILIEVKKGRIKKYRPVLEVK